LLVSVTTVPAAAGAPRVTVAVDVVPPTTLVGLIVTDVTAGGLITSEADCEDPLYDATTAADVEVATGSVVTTNVEEVVFAGTMTLAGICAAGLLLVRLMVAPPTGAGPFRVTAPSDVPPLVIIVGFSSSEVTDGGLTVTVPT
jgi:hypothetical protein